MRNVTAGGLAGFCRPQLTITKAVEEHYNLSQSNNDCIKKGTGSLCAYYPNSELQHGWCFTSNVEAEHYFEVLSNPAINNFLKNISYSNGKGFLKMPVEIAT
ncbi:putative albumin I chain a [Medicago truncatula]|uniref:Albumin I n=1 Tax=Medicago truncatula TaxID=3880 RepID=G7LB06_MEDTR|nr:albumin I [Medicago truncatula]RHN40673.1 putative albumin I chain a [Medicago truncatula]